MAGGHTAVSLDSQTSAADFVLKGNKLEQRGACCDGHRPMGALFLAARPAPKWEVLTELRQYRRGWGGGRPESVSVRMTN